MKKTKRIDRKARLRKILLSRQFCITLLVVMGLLVFICLVKVVLGFMPVKHFTVEGDTHYDVIEIINASGIRSGDKLYRINEKKAEEKLVKGCPYIKSVKIKQKFPNTVCFVVEEQEPGWYIQVGKDFYGLDYDMKVLLETYVEDDFIDRGLTKLVLPELKEVIVGELPRFAKDEYQLEETLKIIDLFRTNEIKSRLTGLDLSNRFEIKLEIDNSYEVYFGDISSFNIKMNFLTEVLKEAESYGGGIITWNETDSTFILKPIYPDPSEKEDENVEEGDIIN
ncbi:MAG: FtsQ-type POTRA domain-containing protein [Ruminococcaceae bacterium]|nr:FtsQ-type POTRA domain-containing protein [Oscillospiraceae bacterium]